MKKQSIIKSQSYAKRVINLYVKEFKNALGMFETKYCTYNIEYDDIKSTESWKVITIKSSLHLFNSVELETAFEVAERAKKNYKDVYYSITASTYQGKYMMLAEPVIEISFPVYPQEKAGEK